jgi:adenylate cyclase
VSRQVAERIVARREIVLEPARRKVTVMFSDIRGFTPMAERLGPQEIFEVLNEYFDVIIQIVFRYDGILDKYIGDCIMAVWGAFGEEKDDALRAVMAAVEMKQTLTALNRKRVAEGKEPIRTGFGLNTGEVTAGSLGALGGDVKRMEYAVVGDPVNLAQRIESHTPSTGLLISESTYAEVAEHVIAREGPPLTVKGKPTKVPVYLVLGLRDGELIYDDDELSEMGLTRARAEQLMSAGR